MDQSTSPRLAAPSVPTIVVSLGVCLAAFVGIGSAQAQDGPASAQPSGDLAPSRGAARASEEKVAIPTDAEAIAQGVSRIVAMQEKGPGADIAAEWPYEGVYRVGGKIPFGYRVGGTSIASMALLAAPGFADDAARKDAVARAVDFVASARSEKLLSPEYDGGYDVRGWAHCYGLRFLLAAKSAGAVSDAQKPEVDAAIAFYLDALKATEIPQVGGWQYARGPGVDNPCPTSPFMTAPCLMALLEAKAAGLEVSDELLARTVKALELTRGESGYVAYNAQRPTRDDPKQIPGAIGRMCAVEVALARAGKGDEKRLRAAVEKFFEFWPELEKRRKKTGTHVAPYGVAPYYFFYAFTHAAAAIEQLPDAERPALRAKFRETLFRVRDADGTWNDRVFPRSASFGTAMSVLALVEAADSAAGPRSR
ncbi:MAG: hypothetical protein LW636_12245 [Planctomycetaceae bacterium]|nr:hypothetical protein [Planctomycetaceae bacterium]